MACARFSYMYIDTRVYIQLAVYIEKYVCIILSRVKFLLDIIYIALIIMTLLSRSSALYTASCAQGSGRPDTRDCSKSQPGSDYTS